MDFDDNALGRHEDIAAMRNDAEETPTEREARKRYRLNFVKLDGTIGCIVNGAGLAMATMDMVKHFGGEPANFLDIGGGAKSEQNGSGAAACRQRSAGKHDLLQYLRQHRAVRSCGAGHHRARQSCRIGIHRSSSVSLAQTKTRRTNFLKNTLSSQPPQ